MNIIFSKGRIIATVVIASYLILYHLAAGMLYQFNDYSEINQIWHKASQVFYISAYGYIMIFIYDYFRYHKLRAHQFIIIIGLLIVRMISTGIKLFELFNYDVFQLLSSMELIVKPDIIMSIDFIPYIFIIEFALKQRKKTATNK